ncbi:MAG TPA: exodeoxyribonuclease V subunit alpha, partial [Ilumatobacteraceae bacterium]
GLAAPTGKAAARLTEAVHDAAARLPLDLAADLTGVQAVTVHRLLEARSGVRRTFRYNRRHPLPQHVVIVDETSMLSLPLTARLLEALSPDARLVLVGDPAQLGSVEAGSVLADVARSSQRDLAACRAELVHSRRYPPGSPLDRLAGAVRAGDADGAVAALHSPSTSSAVAGTVRWIDRPAPDAADDIRRLVEPAALATVDHAVAGESHAAIESLANMRLLCAHRRGPYGVEQWNRHVETWLHADGVATAGWYAGRPVMVTANDHRLQLFNGDTGVVVAGLRPLVAFAGAGDVRLVSPAALDAVDTVHATTIHKSQGSEFDEVVVIAPPASSRLATRELLYTAITRARRTVTVVGTADAIRAAVARPTERTTGLPTRLH